MVGAICRSEVGALANRASELAPFGLRIACGSEAEYVGAKSGSLWKGVFCRRKPLRLLHLLAERAAKGNAFVSVRDIEQHLSGSQLSKLDRPVCE